MNEELILTNLLDNPEYSKKVLSFLRLPYFTDRINQLVFEQYVEFYIKYKDIPTRETLLHNIIALDNLTEDDYSEAISTIQEELVQNETPNLDWLIDRTEQFCKDRALHNAIEKSMLIFQGEDPDKTPKTAIPDIIKDALAVSFTIDVGHDYFEDSQERFDYYHVDHPRIPFSIDILNKITNGGIPRKTLNILLAGVNVGKSLALCHLSSDYLMKGYNVLYVTHEMAEKEIANRIDANLMELRVNDVKDMEQDSFTKNINDLQTKTEGRLIVKEYPTSSAHVGHIEVLLNELLQKRDFVPDIIMVDYIGIMASSRVNLGNTGSYFYIKAIAEELRGLAVSSNTVLWSAMQVTRGGYNDADIDITDTAESFGLPATADFMLGAVRTPEFDEAGVLLFKQLKSRYGNKSWYEKFLVGVDIDMMKLYDVKDDMQINKPNESISPEPPKSSKIENPDKFKKFKF